MINSIKVYPHTYIDRADGDINNMKSVLYSTYCMIYKNK